VLVVGPAEDLDDPATTRRSAGGGEDLDIVRSFRSP
jgi:hypothetical protein